MNKLALILDSELRDRRRWAGQHLYSLLILAPLILGGTYLTAARTLESLPAINLSLWAGILAGIAIEALVVAVSLSRVTTDLYYVRQPEAVLDVLPVSISTRLNALLVRRVVHMLAFAAVILLARRLVIGVAVSGAFQMLSLALLVVLTAIIGILAAFVWIHWAHTRTVRSALIGIITIAPSLGLGGVLLNLAFRRTAPLDNMQLGAVTVAAIWCAVLYLVIRQMYQGWHASDIDFARRLQRTSSRSIFKSRLIKKWFGPSVAAQLARDLQLTVRTFSSAVHVTFGLAGLCLVALFLVLSTNMLPTVDETGFSVTWLPAVLASKVACVFMTAAMSALLPVLVSHQAPLFWLERATGALAPDVWRSKLLFTRAASCVAPFAAWLVAVATGSIPLFYVVPLLLECLWVWWIVSTLIGSLSFETPNQPGLAIALMLLLGLSAGVFTAVFWPAGLLAYVTGGVMSLRERGHNRARYYLSTEDV